MRLNIEYKDLDVWLEKLQDTLPDDEKLTRAEVKSFQAIFYRLAELVQEEKRNPKCDWDRMIKLIERAKGSDRSFRQYAKDGGFQHNIFTRVKNHEFCPGFATISHLVSKEAAPRNGVTLIDFMDAAGLSSEDIIREIDFYIKMYQDYKLEKRRYLKE